MKNRFLAALLFAAIIVGGIEAPAFAQGASTGSTISQTPYISSVTDSDLFLFDSVEQPTGQWTSHMTAYDFVKYVANRIGFPFAAGNVGYAYWNGLLAPTFSTTIPGSVLTGPLSASVLGTANTWTAGQTFPNIQMSPALTVVNGGPTASNIAINQAATVGGASSFAGTYPLNQITDIDSAVMTGSGATGFGFYVNQLLQAGFEASSTGSRAAAGFSTVVQGVPVNSCCSVGPGYVGIDGYGTAAAASFGTGLTISTASSGVGGANFVSQMLNGATNYFSSQIVEFDINDETGSSAFAKEGVEVVQKSTDAVPGAVVDCAYCLVNQGGAVGWLAGLQFGNKTGVWPMQSSGTLIGCQGTNGSTPCGTVAYGIDWRNVTFGTDFLASTGFTVDGSGNTNVASLDVGGSPLAIGNLASIGSKTFVGNNTGSGAAPAAMTVAQAQALLSVPYVLGQSHIPFVMVSSGTMGNNGALSGITALPTAYPAAYVYMPAGAISSGSLAGWYYAVFSTTQAATVYNNTYIAGTPTIPGSPTAFSTTGPGAFTQTTGSFIAAYSLSIAGNTIGANGAARVTQSASFSGSSNAKSIKSAYSTFVFNTLVNATSADVASGFTAGFSNRQATNVQVALASPSGSATLTSTPIPYGAIDSTSNQSLTVQLELATATDFIVLEGVQVEFLPGVP